MRNLSGIVERKPKPAYEEEVKRVIQRFRGDLFVDIGAGDGHYVRLLARRFKTVYAFEPKKDALAMLRLTAKRFGNVLLFEYALSDADGVAEFYHDSHKGFAGNVDSIMSTLQYKPSPSRKGWSSGPSTEYENIQGEMVQTRKYDSVVTQLADLVKIDVEGAEFLVLRGMENSIRLGNIKRLLVELHNLDDKRKLEQYITDLMPAPNILQWITSDHLLVVSGQ